MTHYDYLIEYSDVVGDKRTPINRYQITVFEFDPEIADTDYVLIAKHESKYISLKEAISWVT